MTLSSCKKYGRGCPLLEVILYRVRSFWSERLVRCPEFRGGRFSEVANVLYVWDFQSVTGTLSAVGSVSASRSVRSERFYCIPKEAELGTSKMSIRSISYTKGKLLHQA